MKFCPVGFKKSSTKYQLQSQFGVGCAIKHNSLQTVS